MNGLNIEVGLWVVISHGAGWKLVSGGEEVEKQEEIEMVLAGGSDEGEGRRGLHE